MPSTSSSKTKNSASKSFDKMQGPFSVITVFAVLQRSIYIEMNSFVCDNNDRNDDDVETWVWVSPPNTSTLTVGTSPRVGQWELDITITIVIVIIITNVVVILAIITIVTIIKSEFLTVPPHFQYQSENFQKQRGRT